MTPRARFLTVSSFALKQIKYLYHYRKSPNCFGFVFANILLHHASQYGGNNHHRDALRKPVVRQLPLVRQVH
jgi:hypothetical protein